MRTSHSGFKFSGALFAILLLLAPQAVRKEDLGYFSVWNVGQGLMITHSNAHTCEFIDTGGEALKVRALKSMCQKKKIHLNYTHWDHDHVGFIKKLKFHLGSICLMRLPGGAPPFHKANLFADLTLCKSRSEYSEIQFTRPTAFKSNDSSRIYIYDKILVPGDAEKSSERLFAHRLPSEIHTLVLGHHGSITSTSNYLLSHLPGLRQAIASARKSVYGHPHPKIKKRLQKKGVALISTEDWGNIHLELR